MARPMSPSTKIVVLACLLLVACEGRPKPMTPEAMAAATAECQKHGLDTNAWRNFDLKIVEITCAPK